MSNRIRPQHRRAPLIIDPGDRVFAQVVCNDGAAAIVTVDYDFGPAGYVIDYAARFDPATGFYNLELSKDHNGLRVESFHRLGGVDTACIGQPAPVPLHSDCDPESGGYQNGWRCTTPTPTVASGAQLYLVVGPADRPPTDLRVTAWTLQRTAPGPNGSKCVSYPTPSQGDCAWIGSTAIVAGQDTGAVAGWISSCAIPVPTDTLGIDSAALSRGKLNVVFSTGNETLMTGFNVYAESTKLNTAPIPAKGTGSNSYSFETGRGALKSVRTVFVEALKDDGTIVRTDPVSLK